MASRFFSWLCSPRKLLSFGVAVCLLSPQGFLPAAIGQVTGGPAMPEDWSHHHVLFSNPSTIEQSFRLVNDPRYIQQLVRRYLTRAKTVAGALQNNGESPDPTDFPTIRRPVVPTRSRYEGLWGQSLSGVGTSWASPGPGNYPAKFGFYDTTTINCGNAGAPDYVVYGLKSGTVSSEAGTFTGNPAGAQTVTIGGNVVLTASASTPATGTVTFNNEPQYGDTVTVGSHTYTWQAATTATATGTVTFNSEPHYQDTVTVGPDTYIWQSPAPTAATGTVTFTNPPQYLDKVTVGSVTYTWESAAQNSYATGTVTITDAPSYEDTITVGSTTYIWQSSTQAATATGTVTITNEPDYQDKVTVGSTTYIWQSASNTSATGTVTLSNTPAAGDKVTAGSSTYVWESSCTGINLCVSIGNNTNQNSRNLAGAINGSCGGNSCSANTKATAATGGGGVTLTAITAGSAGDFALSLPVNSAGNSVSGGNNGTNSCAGVNNCLVLDSNTSNDANNLRNAINGSCGGNACSANSSASANASGGVVSLTARNPGVAGDFALTWTVNGAGNSASGGNNGTNSCAGVNDCVVIDSNTSNDVTNLVNAINGSCGGNSCSANASASAAGSGNTANLTARTAGAAGNFTLSLPINRAGNSVSGGSNGANSCAGVNYCVVIDSSTSNDANNLTNAILGSCAGNACSANAAVTPSASGNTVNLTAKTTGQASDFTLSWAVNTGGNSVTGGNNGTNSCSGVNFCIVMNSATSTDASNLRNALTGSCGGNTCAANTSVTPTASGGTVNLTATTTGSAGDFALSMPVNAAGNTVSGGNNGISTCSGVNYCVVMDTKPGNDATNLANAINGTCGGNACAANASATATASKSVVTLTATTAGSGWDFTLTLPVNAGANTVSGGNNATDGLNTGTSFQTGVSIAANAANLAAAIARNASAVGVTATSSSGTVTAQSTIGGSIALATTLSNFSWASGTIAGTLTGGSSSQATLVAYDNLYTSCSGTVPSVYWAYNTSTSLATTAQVITSPVLSVDGTQLAFVETSGSTAYLVILRWKAGNGTSASAPVTPTTQSTAAASYVTCKASSASCQLTLSLSGADTASSPFIDYQHDTLYVGDSSGKLHQVTGVFNGTPMLDTTNAGWPVTVDSGAALTSPVYDSSSSRVFVGDSIGKLSSVGSGASPTSHLSSQIEFRAGGIATAPVVDSTTGSVYVFVACDASCSAATNNAVFKFATSFTSGSGTKQILASTGTAITNQILYAGTFDNTYYSGSGNTGNLYTCGYTTGLAPVLYQIPMSSTWGSASVSSTALASGAGGCTPPTENLSGVASTDWLFLGVTANGDLSGCTGDCIYSFNVYSGSPVYNSGRQASAGSSGIIIDNSASTAGASQIYYATQGVATTAAGYACPSPSGGPGIAATAGGCAVQASQSALR